MKKDLKSTDKSKKTWAIIGITITIILVCIGGWYLGKPLISFVSNADVFKEWVEKQGIFARLGFVAMMATQVVVAIIPGEPLEIAAGFAFGAWEGTALCLLGTTIGSVIIFAAVKKVGMKLVNVFFKAEDLDRITFLKNTEKLKTMLFIIFLIPGTPKDMLSYFVGLTKINMLSWLFISTVARIPSVITSTIGGSALGQNNYIMAAIVFAVTAIISLAGLVIYNHICNKNKKEIKSNGTT